MLNSHSNLAALLQLIQTQLLTELPVNDFQFSFAISTKPFDYEMLDGVCFSNFFSIFIT